MIRIYSSLLALLTATALSVAAASGFRWLTVTFTNDSQLTVAAENLKMKYSDSHLTLTSTSVNETLSTANLKSMRFIDNSAETEEITSAAQESITLYSPSGLKVGEFKNRDAARRALPSGVYIIKADSKTAKLIF